MVTLSEARSVSSGLKVSFKPTSRFGSSGNVGLIVFGQPSQNAQRNTIRGASSNTINNRPVINQQVNKNMSGFYSSLKGGFVTADGKFFPTNNPNFIPSGYKQITKLDVGKVIQQSAAVKDVVNNGISSTITRTVNGRNLQPRYNISEEEILKYKDPADLIYKMNMRSRQGYNVLNYNPNIQRIKYRIQTFQEIQDRLKNERIKLPEDMKQQLAADIQKTLQSGKQAQVEFIQQGKEKGFQVTPVNRQQTKLQRLVEAPVKNRLYFKSMTEDEAREITQRYEYEQEQNKKLEKKGLQSAEKQISINEYKKASSYLQKSQLAKYKAAPIKTFSNIAVKTLYKGLGLESLKKTLDLRKERVNQFKQYVNLINKEKNKTLSLSEKQELNNIRTNINPKLTPRNLKNIDGDVLNTYIMLGLFGARDLIPTGGLLGKVTKVGLGSYLGVQAYKSIKRAIVDPSEDNISDSLVNTFYAYHVIKPTNTRKEILNNLKNNDYKLNSKLSALEKSKLKINPNTKKYISINKDINNLKYEIQRNKIFSYAVKNNLKPNEFPKIKEKIINDIQNLKYKKSLTLKGMSLREKTNYFIKDIQNYILDKKNELKYNTNYITNDIKKEIRFNLDKLKNISQNIRKYNVKDNYVNNINNLKLKLNNYFKRIEQGRKVYSYDNLNNIFKEVKFPKTIKSKYSVKFKNIITKIKSLQKIKNAKSLEARKVYTYDKLNEVFKEVKYNKSIKSKYKKSLYNIINNLKGLIKIKNAKSLEARKIYSYDNLNKTFKEFKLPKTIKSKYSVKFKNIITKIKSLQKIKNIKSLEARKIYTYDKLNEVFKEVKYNKSIKSKYKKSLYNIINNLKGLIKVKNVKSLEARKIYNYDKLNEVFKEIKYKSKNKGIVNNIINKLKKYPSKLGVRLNNELFSIKLKIENLKDKLKYANNKEYNINKINNKIKDYAFMLEKLKKIQNNIKPKNKQYISITSKLELRRLKYIKSLQKGKQLKSIKPSPLLEVKGKKVFEYKGVYYKDFNIFKKVIRNDLKLLPNKRNIDNLLKNSYTFIKNAEKIKKNLIEYEIINNNKDLMIKNNIPFKQKINQFKKPAVFEDKNYKGNNLILLTEKKKVINLSKKPELIKKTKIVTVLKIKQKTKYFVLLDVKNEYKTKSILAVPFPKLSLALKNIQQSRYRYIQNTLQLPIQLIKTIISYKTTNKNILVLKSKLNNLLDIKQDIALISKYDIQSKLKDAIKEISRSKTSTKLITKNRIINRYIKKYNIVNKIIPPKTYNEAKNYYKNVGFNVYVKKQGRKGIYSKINNKPLSFTHAHNLGRYIVDNSPLASYRLLPSKLKIGQSFTKTTSTNKFRFITKRSKLPFGTLVEKRKYRIDTRGEKFGITLKGLMKLKQIKNQQRLIKYFKSLELLKKARKNRKIYKVVKKQNKLGGKRWKITKKSKKRK